MDFLLLFLVYFTLDALFIWLAAELIGVKPNLFESAFKTAITTFLITGLLTLIYTPFPIIALVYLFLKIIAIQWSYNTNLWNAFKIWVSTIILTGVITIIFML